MGEGLDVGASMIRSVLHPTDLTVSSELAFAHALKIALAGKSKLYLLNANPGAEAGNDIDWSASRASGGLWPDGESCLRAARPRM